jgi:hypothetical protein
MYQKQQGGDPSGEIMLANGLELTSKGAQRTNFDETSRLKRRFGHE